MLEEPLLIRATEVSRLTGLSRSKTYELLQSGELPCVRIGKSVRVPMRALREWIEERTAHGTSSRAA